MVNIWADTFITAARQSGMPQPGAAPLPEHRRLARRRGAPAAAIVAALLIVAVTAAAGLSQALVAA